jgi:hypothetical protein
MTPAGARMTAGVALVALMGAVAPAVPAPATVTDTGGPKRAEAAPATWTRSDQFPAPVTRASKYHLESPALRSLVDVVPRADRRSPGRAGRFTRLRPADKPALLAPAGPLAMPFPDRNFNGIAASGGVAPPDTTGEVGPNHYVQAVNNVSNGVQGQFAIFAKNGTTVLPATNISSLWTGVGDSCELKGKGDPVIQYDQLAERWLVTQFAFDIVNGNPSGPFLECVAVSQTADPLGNYWLYSFTLSQSIFPDYPHFGVWPDGYYMTAHLFSTQTGQYQALAVVAFDREAMLKGAPAKLQAVVSQGPAYFGMLASDVEGPIPPPTGSPNFLVTLNDSRDQIELFEYRVDWVDQSVSGVFGPVVLQTGPWDGDMCSASRDCIPQPGTPTRLDAAANQSVMYRAAYRNFGNREALVINHTVDATGTDLAAVRWYEIDDLQGSPFLAQGATHSPDATNRWMGSIAMDRSGDIAVGFSGSSANEFPSIRYAGRLANDPPDALAQGEVFLSGNGSQLGPNRWGDYSHMSVDPADDCTFWYTNEYYATSSQASWSTAIISFRFPSCNPTLPPPPDHVAPGINNVRDRPDPFTPARKVKISWTLTEAATVDVGIFKPNGRLVGLLVRRNPLTAGNWFTKWNGAGVRAGTYKFTIEARDAAGNVRRAGGKVHLIR